MPLNPLLQFLTLALAESFREFRRGAPPLLEPLLGKQGVAARAFEARGERDDGLFLHAGAADDNAAIVRVPLHAIHIRIIRNPRIAGEEVTSQVHCLDVVARTEIADAEEVNPFRRVGLVSGERFEERVGVQRRRQLALPHPADWRLRGDRRCRRPRRAGSTRRTSD